MVEEVEVELHRTKERETKKFKEKVQEIRKKAVVIEVEEAADRSILGAKMIVAKEEGEVQALQERDQVQIVAAVVRVVEIKIEKDMEEVEEVMGEVITEEEVLVTKEVAGTQMMIEEIPHIPETMIEVEGVPIINRVY